MSAKNKIFRGFLYKSLSTVMISVLGLVTSIVVNRHYGIEQYGLLIMVFTVTGLCCGFSNLGTKQTLNKYLPELLLSENHKKQKVFMLLTHFIFLFIGSVFFAGMVYVFRDLIAGSFSSIEVLPLITIGAAYILTFSAVDFLFSICEAFQNWTRNLILTVFYPSVYLVFIFIAIYKLPGGIANVLYANMASAFATVLLGVILFRGGFDLKLIREYSFLDFKQFAYKIKTFGFPLLIGSLGFLFVNFADKYLLASFLGAKSISIYYIAFMFIQALLLLSKSFYTVAMPYAAQLTGVADEEKKGKFEKIFKINLHIACLLSVVMFFLIEPFVLTFYGDEYVLVIFAVRLFLPLVVIKAIYNTPAIFLQNVFGKIRYLNYGVFLLIATNLIACVTLIPLYGIIGAIVAHMLAYLVYSVWLFISPDIRRLMSGDLVSEMGIYYLLLGVLVFVSHQIVHFPSIASAVLIVLIYATILFVRDDFGLLKRA